MCLSFKTGVMKIEVNWPSFERPQPSVWLATGPASPCQRCAENEAAEMDLRSFG